MNAAAQAALPLTGLRVLEFSHMVMGPTCGMILGDLGADVIKIEPIEGDNTRRLEGAGAGFFPVFCRNKRSFSVDLKTEAGIRLVQRLIEGSDILVENFRPGALDALGLGYADAQRCNAQIVYVSLKGFLSGPYENRTALDEVVQMMGGLAYMTGSRETPSRVGSSVNDIMGGMFGAIGAIAAIHARSATGRGSHVRAALFENTVLLVAQHMAQFELTGREPPPMAQRDPAWGVYDIFPTADGRLFIAAATDRQWQSFCRCMNAPELLADAQLETNAGRYARRPDLLPAIATLTRTVSTHELVERLEAAGLPFAPINTPAQLLDDRHLREGGGLLDVATPDMRRLSVPALPLELDGKKLGVRRQPPQLGGDTTALLLELGLSEAEIDGLVERGIVNRYVGKVGA